MAYHREHRNGNGRDAAYDRRKSNTMSTILAGVSIALIMAIIMGYVTLYSNVHRLTMIADFSERRLNVIEAELKRCEQESARFREVVTRFDTHIERLINDVQFIKNNAMTQSAAGGPSQVTVRSSTTTSRK